MSRENVSENTEYLASSRHSGEESKRPCLIMIKGDFIGQVYELGRDVTMLGRSDEVDLVISDMSISRRHAMIVNRVDGFHVSDLGSTNGSFVNREPVRSPTRLEEGDKLALGNITFKFSYQDDDDTQYHLMLRNMAIKDGLTRVYNKRYFVEALDKEFDYNRRKHAGLGLLLIDIDHFKLINDKYGHPAGDFVLKHLAQLVQDEARGYDVLARYGGDEFVFVIRGGTVESVVALAERVRGVVENHTFSYGQVDINVTVSIGVVFWGGEDSLRSSADLIELVDRQLDEARKSGRNCVKSMNSDRRMELSR